MPLPWVRLDSNIASHDKILELVNDPSAQKWQAAASYVFALAWSGGAGTDGLIRKSVLPVVHATPKTARLLEKYGLWKEVSGGYEIVNYAERQQLQALSKALSDKKSEGGRRGNCIRWHGETCWRDGKCSREAVS